VRSCPHDCTFTLPAEGEGRGKENGGSKKALSGHGHYKLLVLQETSREGFSEVWRGRLQLSFGPDLITLRCYAQESPLGKMEMGTGASWVETARFGDLGSRYYQTVIPIARGSRTNPVSDLRTNFANLSPRPPAPQSHHPLPPQEGGNGRPGPPGGPCPHATPGAQP
jgi:hypothetical protein